MANRRSNRFNSGNVRKTNSHKEWRWVENVLLMDLKKVGLLPPDCGDARISRKPSLGSADINENSASHVSKLNSDECIESYVTASRSGNCFVPECSFSTKSFVSLLCHVLGSHKEVNEFNCPYCVHSSSLCDMVEHLNMHGPSMFQCKYCHHHHFSQLKVREHIKSKHPKSPLVVVELRDFKEEEDCDTTEVENRNAEAEIVECDEEEPLILKEELCEWECKEDAEVLEKVNVNADKPESSPKNFENELNDDCELSSWVTEPKRPTGYELEKNPNEIYCEITHSKFLEEREIIEVKNCCKSENSESKELSKLRKYRKDSPSKSLETSQKKTKLAPESIQVSFEPVKRFIENKVNLKSTSYNYHSSELDVRKDALEKNWQCGLCDYVGLYNNMIAHAESAHDVKYQFQCSKCSIFIASRGYVESHCLIFHPNSPNVTLTAYYYLPESSLPFKSVTVSLPDGQKIFSPDEPVFSRKIPVVCL